MKQEQSLTKLVEVLHNDKKLWEKRARVYQEALNMIVSYIDSYDADIGLTEYSNILRIIKQADEEIGRL